MSITLHHLNASRSLRILWLLEEIGQPYTLVRYQRDAVTRLAPASLKAIHQLGKSPVVEVDGLILAESGAIVEYLIARYAPHLAPDRQSREYAEYLQWMHFAESSAMLPVLLEIFGGIEEKTGTHFNFLSGYTKTELDKVLGYLDEFLHGKEYLVGNKLSGADFMMVFVAVTVCGQLGLAEQYPNFSRYLAQLQNIESWQRAMRLEKNTT
jgi:glutathione S-transferase